VTLTEDAKAGVCSSRVEELIPRSKQLTPMLPDQRGYPTQLGTTIAATVVKTNRIEPELRPAPRA
jgi:hypothetical protein